MSVLDRWSALPQCGSPLKVWRSLSTGMWGARIKHCLRLAVLGVALSGCASDPMVPGWMRGDWRCAARDSNGNPYFGVDSDKKAALEKARWQCVSGSPYKQSCEPEPAYCEQME